MQCDFDGHCIESIYQFGKKFHNSESLSVIIVNLSIIYSVSQHGFVIFGVQVFYIYS